MILIRLETEDGRFVGNVEIAPFETLPNIVIWDNRHFLLKNSSPPALMRVIGIYWETFAAVSLTTPRRSLELS